MNLLAIIFLLVGVWAWFNQDTIERMNNFFNNIFFFLKLIPVLITAYAIYKTWNSVEKTSSDKWSDTLLKIGDVINVPISGTIPSKSDEISSHTQREVAQNYDWKCGRCGKYLDTDYKVDYIMPKHKFVLNSAKPANHKSNMQPLCSNCS